MARTVGGAVSRCILALLLLIASAGLARANVCYQLEGATILTEDGDYLGKIAGRLDPDSIFNKFGPYGSRFSDRSIWNMFGRYGGKFSRHSPFNLFGTPPLVIKGRRLVAYLSENDSLQGAVDPVAIAVVCYGLEDYAQLRP
jgi:hypothetical protein